MKKLRETFRGAVVDTFSLLSVEKIAEKPNAEDPLEKPNAGDPLEKPNAADQLNEEAADASSDNLEDATMQCAEWMSLFSMYFPEELM